jgi:hypothetical protein
MRELGLPCRCRLHGRRSDPLTLDVTTTLFARMCSSTPSLLRFHNVETLYDVVDAARSTHQDVIGDFTVVILCSTPFTQYVMYDYR